MLLANDKGLIEVARTHGVDRWWITTLLLSCIKNGDLTAEVATGLLYDLVDEGMNPSDELREASLADLEEASCNETRGQTTDSDYGGYCGAHVPLRMVSRRGTHVVRFLDGTDSQ